MDDNDKIQGSLHIWVKDSLQFIIAQKNTCILVMKKLIHLELGVLYNNLNLKINNYRNSVSLSQYIVK